MAIDFPASPTNGQTFTSGALVYTYDGTKWTAQPAGVTGGTKIEVANTKAEIVDTGSDGRFVVTTEGSERLRVNSAGEIGLAGANYGTSGQVLTSGGTGAAPTWSTPAAADKISEGNTSAEVIDTGSDGRFVVTTEGTERARVDSSGRLLVGTNTARNNFYTTTFEANVQIESTDGAGSTLTVVRDQTGSSGPNIVIAKSRGTAVNSNTVVNSGDALGTVSFQGADGSALVEAVRIRAEVDGTPGANDMPGRLVFSTTADGASSPTERMRITSDGYVSLFNGTSTFLRLNSSNSAGTSDRLIYGAHSATSNTSGTECFRVNTNGNVQNTNNSYGAISDVKLKENIVDAASQWNDLKFLQVRNYNFKEETGQQTHTQIGLVAQEVELVSPGLVTESPDRDEEGNETGEVTKSVNYSVLYMKAVKALQEAMERIEQLESEMAEVKAQLQAS